VEQKSTGGQRVGFENFKKRPPRADAVDGEREVALSGKSELGSEDFGLQRDVSVFLRAVEPAFADPYVGEAVEVGSELGEPVWVVGCIGDIPRVEAERGDDEIGVGLRELCDGWPVAGVGAVDDATGDS